jgi:two-component system chemotaxis sensor kinase CheA
LDFQENENNIQELLSIFQVESEEILEKIFDNLLSFESNPTDKELCATLYRELHSLKGAVRMVGFNNIQNIVHKIEDIFDKIKEQKAILAPDNVRILYKALELVSFYLKERVLLFIF